MKTNQSVREIVNAWIHDLPDLSVASIVTSDEKAATSRANFLGEDNSDPAAAGMDIYSKEKNLPTAVSSIMNHNMTKAKFHPAAEDPKTLYASFLKYVEVIDSCPFLHLTRTEKQQQSFSSKNYNQLIDQVVGLYDSVSQSDKNKIKDSIANIAKSVFSQTKSDAFTNLFSEVTLDFDRPNPKLYLYFTQLRMKYEHKGLFKPDVEEQEYTVHVTEYDVLKDVIKAYASELAKIDKTNLDDWLKESTTKERKDAALCFKVTPYKEVELVS